MLVQTDNFGYSCTYKAELFEGKYDYPMHLHQYAEIVYVFSGELSLTANGNEEKLCAGCCAFIMPFQAHRLHTENYCKILIYVFSETVISDFFEKGTLVFGEKCVFTPSEVTRAYALQQLCFPGRYISGNHVDTDGIRKIKSGIYALGVEYFSGVKLSEKAGENDMLSKMLIYISNHFNERLTLASVAEVFGYNSNYISHCFKSTTGMSFCSFLNCVRVEKAKALLLSTKLTAVEIADKCGFTCERNLHRAFKALTGTTPLNYRSNGA